MHIKERHVAEGIRIKGVARVQFAGQEVKKDETQTRQNNSLFNSMEITFDYLAIFAAAIANFILGGL